MKVDCAIRLCYFHPTFKAYGEKKAKEGDVELTLYLCQLCLESTPNGSELIEKYKQCAKERSALERVKRLDSPPSRLPRISGYQGFITVTESQ